MLIREIAYETLPKQTRRERHTAVARFIEEGAGDRVEESAGILAHHWREGGEPGRAADYLLIAAEHAGRARAKGKAEEFFAEALKLIPEEEVGRWRSVLLRRALLWVELGAYQDAIAELDSLLPGLEGRNRFDALLARAQAAFWLTDAESTRRFGEEAHELAQELGDNDLLAEIHSLLAAASGMDGDVEGAVALAENALSLWGAGRRSRQVGPTHEWASIENYWLGRYDESLERGRAAYELGKEFHNVAAWINGGAHIGLALTGLGLHEEALATFEHVAAEGRELELVPRFTSRLLNMWAGALRELQELDAARALNEEAVENSARAKFPGGEISGRIDLLVTDLIAGDIGKAEAAWPKLWERAEASKGWHQWLWMARLAEAKAEIELAAGRPEQAAEHAAKALAHAERYKRLKYAFASRIVLGAALLELGRQADAVAAFEQALAEAERLKHPPSIWKAAGGLARASAGTADDERTEAASRKARETIEAFAAGLSDERRERFLSAVLPVEIPAVG